VTTDPDVPAPEIDAEAAQLLVSLADDDLVIGHRYSEWLGLAPFLEEDLTLASIAQDEIGHARALYELVWPSWQQRDALVVLRPASAWRSQPLSECRSLVWEHLLIRHWLHDIIEQHRWRVVEDRFGARVAGLSALAERVAQEEHFHREHAGALVRRLCADDAARQHLRHAFDAGLDAAARSLARLHAAGGADPLVVIELITTEAIASGLGDDIGQRLAASIERSEADRSQLDRTARHADAAEILEQLRSVWSIDPSATW
jgi:phenylacetate-CoA oxygenase PaaI subunit